MVLVGERGELLAAMAVVIELGDFVFLDADALLDNGVALTIRAVGDGLRFLGLGSGLVGRRGEFRHEVGRRAWLTGWGHAGKRAGTDRGEHSRPWGGEHRIFGVFRSRIISRVWPHRLQAGTHRQRGRRLPPVFQVPVSP